MNELARVKGTLYLIALSFLHVSACDKQVPAGPRYVFADEWDRDALSGGLFVSAFYDVAVSPSGTIYVSDALASRVRYFRPPANSLASRVRR